MSKRVAILISGGGSNMEALVRSMAGDHPARPVLALSNVRNAGGLARADALGVPTAVVDHKSFAKDRAAFDAEVDRTLRAFNPDIICLAGFMRILTANFIQGWEGQMLNIHPSLLPRHKGLNTHARVLDAQETEHGCTVHEVTPELDDGPILGQAKMPVLHDDSPENLAKRLLPLEHALYAQVLRRFADGERGLLTLP